MDPVFDHNDTDEFIGTYDSSYGKCDIYYKDMDCGDGLLIARFSSNEEDYTAYSLLDKYPDPKAFLRVAPDWYKWAIEEFKKTQED